MLNLQYLKTPEKIVQVKNVRSNIYALSEKGNIFKCKIDEIETLRGDIGPEEEKIGSSQQLKVDKQTNNQTDKIIQSKKINWKKMNSIKEKIKRKFYFRF